MSVAANQQYFKAPSSSGISIHIRTANI